MKPTVGRVVYYNDGPNHLASIITKVWSENSVNLVIFGTDGKSESGIKITNGQRLGQWDWMPYQKEKAAAGDHNSESAEPRPETVQ